MSAGLIRETTGTRTSDMAMAKSPRHCRRSTVDLLLRAHEFPQAGVLLIIAAVTHVVIGESTIAVPGSVSAAAVNAALLGGLLAGAAVTFACATTTPWWAWGSRRRAALVTAVPLTVAVLVTVALAFVAEAVTGRPAVGGWCGSIGLGLIVLSFIPRPALASMIMSAVAIAVVAVVPEGAPGPVVGLSAATWYDPAPPLGSGGTPFVLLLLGVCALLVRGLITGRTVQA